MKVGEIMTRAVVTVRMDDTLKRIQGIFEESRFHHVLVVEDGKLVGVISDRDLLKHLSPFIGQDLMERRQDTSTLQRRAHQIMRRQPVVANEEMSVKEAAELLLREDVSCLPVVSEKQHVRGIVTWRDLLSHTELSGQPEADAA
jgi:acetoin utilization protein AcuB